MKPYRCLICGETYLGTHPSDHCPFCGAAGKYLVSAAEWVNYANLQISPASASLCEQALGFEIDNVGFYNACIKQSETQISQAIFKRLSRQELEHAEVFAKMLRRDLPAIPNLQASQVDEEKFKEAHTHEQRAIRFYLQAAEQAVEPRVKQVFYALAEVEEEHLILSNVYR